MGSKEKAVIKTLLYSDLFHFPLTSEEIWKYLHSPTSFSKNAIDDTLSLLIKKEIITNDTPYFCLKGKEAVLLARKKQQKNFELKMSSARKASYILSFIPTILFIGLSGSLAAGQADEDADIDFFIITVKDTVWTTRLLSFLLFSLLRMRRTKEMGTARDKICLNYFIDETALSLSSNGQDIYTAREIAQLKPLYNKNKTYELFLQCNTWVRKYLSHTTIEETAGTHKISTGSFFYIFFQKIEYFTSFLQQYYMTGNTHKDAGLNQVILFHNTRYREKIIGQFEARLRDYSLLTK